MLFHSLEIIESIYYRCWFFITSTTSQQYKSYIYGKWKKYWNIINQQYIRKLKVKVIRKIRAFKLNITFGCFLVSVFWSFRTDFLILYINFNLKSVLKDQKIILSIICKGWLSAWGTYHTAQENNQNKWKSPVI